MTVSYRPTALQRQRFVLLVLFVLSLTLLGSSAAFRDGLSHLLAAAQAAVASYPLRGALLFVLYCALAAMLAFVSSSVLVPVAIYAWGQEVTFILLWIGWLAGGMVSYVIGRYLGRPMVRWLTSAEQIALYEQRIGARARFPLVLLFQLALPSEIPGYVLGLLGYSFWRYLLILSLAELPYAIAATFLGEALIQGQMLRFAFVALAGIALLAYAFRNLHRLLGEPDTQGAAPNGGNESPRVP